MASPASASALPAPSDFTVVETAVTAADLPHSWRDGCPVGPADLRRLELSHWGFDGRARTGILIVHRDAAGDLRSVFAALWREKFPIRLLRPVDEYGGSDDDSMAADNTSAFNCRNAVSTGPPRWSAHAYGRAVDVNPVENPYLISGRVLPPAGAQYTDRANVRPGMAVAGGPLVRAFEAVGWTWGGRWSAPDYQHFSQNGR
ncbi:hypothetical protein Val02_73040 [Virgisporangium aliadipatigenens]|uniref:Peptidase M15C domain-containing protein n=1 Tax=Virgisporangium aliadipatigenens TaxID=741659 RepID=A0A8J3YTZ1_9ACTN|nr:hypothetical protein Val02_73040 [Virgisporangium aliadipatigenens]